jgi:hypothetical protein
MVGQFYVCFRWVDGGCTHTKLNEIKIDNIADVAELAELRQATRKG